MQGPGTHQRYRKEQHDIMKYGVLVHVSSPHPHATVEVEPGYTGWVPGIVVDDKGVPQPSEGVLIPIRTTYAWSPNTQHIERNPS